MDETRLTDLSGVNNPCYSTAGPPDGFDDTTLDGDNPEKDENNKYENVPQKIISQRNTLKMTDDAAVLNATAESIVVTSNESLKFKALLIAVVAIAIASVVIVTLALVLSLWGSLRPPALQEEVSSFNSDIENLQQLVKQLNDTLLTHGYNIESVNSSLFDLTTVVNFDVNSTLNSHGNSINNLSDTIQVLNSVVAMESGRINHSLGSNEVSIQTVSDNLQTLTDFLSLMPIFECGPGDWLRIAYINMTDSSQQCPSAWREYTTPVRSCGRPVTSSASCPFTMFSVHGYTYSKVCGRAIGYQYSSTDAFHLLPEIPQPQTVNDLYVDGISVTYGVPRNHVWTFAAGHTDSTSDSLTCPCANSEASPSPSFVGSNYFCESGTSLAPIRRNVTFFSNNPLWDGEGCINTQCCNFNSPPWFKVQLPSSTSDAIEVRICGDEGTSNEDTPIRLLEIYIQ